MTLLADCPLATVAADYPPPLRGFICTTYQFPCDNPDQDRVVAIHHLLALLRQTLIRDELTGLLQVFQNICLQSQRLT